MMISTTAIVHFIYMVGKSLTPMYDPMMAVPRVFSAMRKGRIHSKGLRISRMAEISVILLLTIALAFAQVSPIHTVAAAKPQPPSSTSATWAKAYNIPYSYSLAESVAQTSSGGYVVGASCTAAAVTTPNCNTLSEPTAMVMRVDSSGNIQSQTQYNYVKYPYSTSLDLIRPTSDGGAIFAGNAQFGCPATGQTSCGLIVKVELSGNVQWSNDLQFSTSSSYGPLTWPLDLHQTTDGGFILGVLVFISTANSYSSSVLLLKLDSTGSPQFAKTYAPSGSISDLAITGVQQTSDGGYAFSGYYFQNTVYDERAWLVKTDSAGKVQWDRTYGADVQYSSRKFYSFQQTSDGGFIAAGSTNQFNGGDNSLWLVKTDSNGNIAGCNDVQTQSDVSGTVSVTVSNSDLKATPDSFTYVADTLSSLPGPLKATKEC